MGLDGIFLRGVLKELKEMKGARVEKIFQISNYEIVFLLKKFKIKKNLLISVSANAPKIHFTNKHYKDVAYNSCFIMLLKSRLKSKILSDIVQKGLDRVLELQFEGYDDIGEKKNYTLAVELILRYSNIILFDKDTLKIEDAIKRISLNLFSKRPILPKLKFIALEKQEKINILKEDTLDVVNKLLSMTESSLKEAMMRNLQGIGKFVANILTLRFSDKKIKNFSTSDKEALFQIISDLKKIVLEEKFEFVAVFEEGQLKEYSFFNILKYTDKYTIKRFSNAGELLDFFYFEKSFLERKTQTKNSIIKFLKNEITKTKNKIKAREKDFEEIKEKSKYKKFADLLKANIYRVKQGQSQVVVQDYENGEQICLPLNSKLSGPENLQNYYKTYKKSQIAKEKLEILIEEAKQELIFLRDEFGFLTRCTNEKDFLDIVDELKEQNYNFNLKVKNKSKNSAKTRSEEMVFLKFKTTDGFSFCCGKNNKQNEILTFKKAKGNDIWFHVSDFSGSHVVLFTNNKKATDNAIVEAATVAAYYSSAQNEKKVDVWYTLIKNVSKIKGAKPGMVNFKNYKTINVYSNFELVQNLKEEG